MYPAICLQNNFIVGPGIRLIGPQMVSRLRLDYDRGCFVYRDPETHSEVPCDGVIQVVIGLDKDNHEVNRLPFLPIRLAEARNPKDRLRTFRASCYACLLTKQKTLCRHSNEQRRFRQTYTMNKVS